MLAILQASLPIGERFNHMRMIKRGLPSLTLALCLILVPCSAFASDEGTTGAEVSLVAGQLADNPETTDNDASKQDSAENESQPDDADGEPDSSATSEEAKLAEQREAQMQQEKQEREKAQEQLKQQLDGLEAERQEKAEEEARRAENEKKAVSDKTLKYDKKAIAQIGTQEQTGHTICCPSFSCAYGDAVLDGTVHDHAYYTCSCCTWNDWGGGSSVSRSAGSNEKLLRESYDQIAKGRPTVIHVAHGGGEHWICLIGYKNVKDPDHLELSNFIALDPWDGAQITASDRYSLYGDCCQHISSR